MLTCQPGAVVSFSGRSRISSEAYSLTRMQTTSNNNQFALVAAPVYQDNDPFLYSSREGSEACVALATTSPWGVARNCDDWRLVLDIFLASLDSPATKKAYRFAVVQAMAQLGSWANLSFAALLQYRAACLARLSPYHPHQLAPATVTLLLAGLKSFLNFARRIGLINLPEEQIRLSLKPPKATVIKPYQILSASEQESLVNAAQHVPRDHVLLRVLLTAGLRAAEACRLCVGDLITDSEEDVLLRVRGKANQGRVIPVRRDVAEELRRYLRMRGIRLDSPEDAEECLFPSRKTHGPLSTTELWHLVTTYAQKARICKRTCPHMLRHTAASDWLRLGANPVVIQKMLGHKDLNLTMRYVDHTTLDDCKAAINSQVVPSGGS